MQIFSKIHDVIQELQTEIDLYPKKPKKKGSMSKVHKKMRKIFLCLYITMKMSVELMKRIFFSNTYPFMKQREKIHFFLLPKACPQRISRIHGIN